MALRDAGMEVIYTGRRQTANQIVEAAVQEDVDVLGLSILSGDHLILTEKVTTLAKARGMQDVLILVGGIVLKEDIPKLKAMGVGEIFLPGSPLGKIIEFIRENVRKD
jgi:methylmalonyl-CoA mutase C-terminal domain/subunit